MTDDDPLRVEVPHRGRRRRVDVVFEVTPMPDGPLYLDGVVVGNLVAGVRVHMRLHGGHELTDRFVEEMAEDLGPAEEEAEDVDDDGGGS